jgi:carboxyl-terminal processing protease
MKNRFLSLIVIVTNLFFINGCSTYDETTSNNAVQNFIWKGLNSYYLYQDNIPDLNDLKNQSFGDLNAYTSQFTPESLFSNLLYNRSTVDKYSVLFSNYTQLEQALSGSSDTNGLKIGISLKTGSTTDVFGWIKYIMPNSDASIKPIFRGTIFSGINGTPLTVSNYRALLANTTYTLNLADYNSGSITPNGISVTLTKSAYSENPVLYTNTYTVNAKKVGYLVYNGFYNNYENDLNNAFGALKNQNITDLVLDLRYNPGGSIATATRLASMITGQFYNQLFSIQQWNRKIQPQIDPQNSNEYFTNRIGNGNQINSLNLGKVYILTTNSTASASELVINCLKPYINVIQIGATTTGKNVGSITMYDSPNFSKQGVNPNHKYAMQPIVLKTANRLGFGDYSQGITPEIATNILNENIGNLGVLGDVSEPLLAKALNLVLTSKINQNTNFKTFTEIQNSDEQSMFVDKLPE